MATYFTDEQINEILSIFRQNLGHRQYIGARYVPIFGRIGETSIEWDNSAPYEPLTIVLHQGNSFTSRQYVPAGIDITNTDFWAETGNFNAQIEQYRQEVLGFDERITENAANITELQNEQPKINDIAELTNKDNAIFYNHDVLSKDDVLTKNIGNVVFVKENLSLENAIAAGLQSTLNINGNDDMCEAITLFNSYAANSDQLTYANDYTATTYEGTFDNPTLCNPSDHRTNGLMHIDCATLTNLIGDGVMWDASNYALSTRTNRALHAMYNPVALTSKAYWKYSPHDDRETDIGFGRVLSDGFAKMLFDSGTLTFLDGFSESLTVGDILFSGVADNRFLGITHCSIIVGSVNNTLAGTIVGEAVSTVEHTTAVFV